MTDIDCINCGKKFTKDFDYFKGIVKCSECGKNMRVTIKEKKVEAMEWDAHQFVEDLAKINDEGKVKDQERLEYIIKIMENEKEKDQKRLEMERDLYTKRIENLMLKGEEMLNRLSRPALGEN